MITPILLIILVVAVPINTLVYGLANRKIAKDYGKNHKVYFAWGLLGALGMIITMVVCIKPSFKLIGFGFLRLILYAILLSILNEIDLLSEMYNGFLHWFIGIPFVFRGKNIFNY